MRSKQLAAALLVILLVGLPAHSGEVKIDYEGMLLQEGVDLSFDGLVAAMGNKSLDTDIRSISARLLGRTKDERAFDHLIALLDSDDYRLRAAALEGMIELEDIRSLDRYEAALSANENEVVQSLALTALMLDGSPKSRAIIDAVALRVGSSADLLVPIIEFYERSPSETSDQSLAVMLENEEIDVRTKAAIVLSRNHDGIYLDRIVSSMNSPALEHTVWLDALVYVEEASGISFGPDSKYSRVRRDAIVRQQINDSIAAWWSSQEQPNSSANTFD